MARKQNYDYYEAFANMASYACKAAEIVYETLHNFNQAELPKTLETIHKIEHAADEQKHELMTALAREFLPPIEIEDIAGLVQLLDDVVDAVEDVLIKLYSYNIKTIRPEAAEFSNIILKSCNTLKSMMEQFVNFKKSGTLDSYIIEINNFESDGDELFTSAMYELHVTSKDPIDILTWSRMLDCFERCCDALEDVADTVSHIIMKNT